MRFKYSTILNNNYAFRIFYTIISTRDFLDLYRLKQPVFITRIHIFILLIIEMYRWRYIRISIFCTNYYILLIYLHLRNISILLQNIRDTLNTQMGYSNISMNGNIALPFCKTRKRGRCRNWIDASIAGINATSREPCTQTLEWNRIILTHHQDVTTRK